MPVKKQPPKQSERTWHEEELEAEYARLADDADLDGSKLKARIVELIEREPLTEAEVDDLERLTEQWKARKRRAKKQARIDREWALVDEVVDASDVEAELERILRRANGERPPKNLRRKESNR